MCVAQIFVSQFGGLCTIQNTGSDPIKAGDYVVWDLPRTQTEGTNMCGKKEKQMVIVRPYRRKAFSLIALTHDLSNDESDVAKAVAAAAGGARPIDAGVLYALMERVEEEKGRIIGRAMSDADNPGETFDILLGKYSA